MFTEVVLRLQHNDFDLNKRPVSAPHSEMYSGKSAGF